VQPLRLPVLAQDPGQLCRGKVGVERQARRRLHDRLAPRGAQPVGHIRRPVVLPHDDRPDRHPGFGIPTKAALALIGDPHRLHAQTRRRLEACAHICQQFLAVMFHPAGAGVVLRMGPRHQDPRAPGIHQQRTGRCRPLINGKDRHPSSSNRISVRAPAGGMGSVIRRSGRATIAREATSAPSTSIRSRPRAGRATRNWITP